MHFVSNIWNYLWIHYFNKTAFFFIFCNDMNQLNIDMKFKNILISKI
jgi:hypothetical protein